MPAKKVSLDNMNEKPSLASLMPDKSKGVTAKRRSVKKIDAASSTNAPLKKARATAIKNLSQRKLLSKAPVAAASPTTKLPPKKVSLKRTVSSKSFKGEKPQPKSEQLAKTEFAVKLPSNMSIRAREKTLALLHYAMHEAREPIQKVAYASSFVFIVFGSFLALTFTFVVPNENLQSATVTNSVSTISEGTGTATAGVQTPAIYSYPEFSSSDQLPAQLTADLQYSFYVTNAKNVGAKLYSLAEGRKITLETGEIDANTYRTYLKLTDLVPGEYRLELFAEAMSDGSKHMHYIGNFVIPGAETSQTSDTIENTESEATEEETIVTETAEVDVIAADEAELETEEEIIEEIPEKVTELKLLVDGGDFSNREVIKIEAPAGVPGIELYARPLKSIQSMFLGSAIKGTSYWHFFFDTLQVPNGEYELFARARVGSSYLSGEPRRIRVANAVTIKSQEADSVMAETHEREESETETKEVEADAEGLTQEVKPISLINTDTPARSFSELSEEEFVDISSSSKEYRREIDQEVHLVFDEYRDELQDLLKRYSVAEQSGNELMIELARKELFDSRDELIEEILNDSETNYLADDVEKVLTSRLELLQKRAETFEQLRRSANVESVNIDTDGDGISDFDEKNLYHTNTEQADTDNDGVTDGIEIMRGFDPLDSAAEAVIKYEMPQESFALVQEEELKIETVNAIVQTDTTDTELPIFAEIKGKALPNSFVTLYIFSSPTIVTIRTDTDGSFVYTFEKELEDGEHEVYVAVTDNTGSIMARSNPFKFIKEAQAFTPVTGAVVDAGSSESLSEFTSANSYNIAIGLGILAFGIILLMLGVSLREKEGDTLIKPSHDLKTS